MSLTQKVVFFLFLNANDTEGYEIDHKLRHTVVRSYGFTDSQLVMIAKLHSYNVEIGRSVPAQSCWKPGFGGCQSCKWQKYPWSTWEKILFAADSFLRSFIKCETAYSQMYPLSLPNLSHPSSACKTTCQVLWVQSHPWISQPAWNRWRKVWASSLLMLCTTPGFICKLAFATQAPACHKVLHPKASVPFTHMVKTKQQGKWSLLGTRACKFHLSRNE